MASKNVDKTDLMLLLLYAPDHAGVYAAPVHGITRLEKLVFLLEKEGALNSVGEQYEFEPYKFGPFSSDVYDVIQALQGWRLVDVQYRMITDYYESAEAQRLAEDFSDEEDEAQGEASPEQNERIAYREKIITLTERGKLLGKKLMDKLSAEDWQALTRLKQKYGALSLRHLIAYVYDTYPESAIKSELV